MNSLVNSIRRRSLLPLVGLLLVPLSIAGLLAWSLGSPENRIEDVKAAVVNADEPVKVNGRLAPMGRQLSAKLVGGEIKSNYSWEFATERTAAEGLRSGEYVAVVTIPKNFSEAATSFSRDPAKARRAQIDVTTGDRGRLADEAISRHVTSTAANLLSRQLTTTYLDNIYVGFNTLNDKLGDASGGASSLADGAKQLAGGTDQLSGGAGQLAQGTRQLADGLGQLDGGAAQLAGGMSGLSQGLDQLRDQTAKLPQQSGMLADVAAQESQGVQQLAGGIGGLAQKLDELSKQCPPGIIPMCNELAVQAATANALNNAAGPITQASSGVSGGLDAMAGRTPDSAGGLAALAGGVDQLATGARQLAGGAGQLHDGVSQTAGGADQLATGADKLASGAGGLADGLQKFSDGTGGLSSGLDRAVRELPSYPDGERDQLAEVVANPIAASDSEGLNGTGLSLYAVLALWIGALANFLLLRSVPSRTLESTRSSLVLTVRHFGLPAGIAIAQGVLVAGVLGWAQGLSVGAWFATAGLAALIAVAFTAVNQALDAALGGTGRFVSMLVGLVVLANGFVAAIPGVLAQLLPVLPVGPAIDALRLVNGTTGSVGGMVAVLAVWAISGLGVTCLAVERRRAVRPAHLLATYGVRGRRAELA